MGIPKVNAVQSAKVSRAISKVTDIKNGKTLAKQKQELFNMYMQREAERTPQPYHIMPELNFLGLWKWF